MRLFIGLDLPNEIKSNLLEFQNDLKNDGVKGFYKRVENFHLTIEFLGEISINKLNDLKEIISKVALNHKVFLLELSGLGCFPSLKRPHTLWSGFKGELDKLHALQVDLRKALLNKEFILEDRLYKPHMSLISRPDFCDKELSEYKDRHFGKFEVNEVVLFESKSEGGKRIYNRVFSSKLISKT